jgi:hypothetical protein
MAPVDEDPLIERNRLTTTTATNKADNTQIRIAPAPGDVTVDGDLKRRKRDY